MASNLRYRDYASPVHPLADFLNKQLPMMLQQHKQNKADRIHQIDMQQMRLDGQKEVAEINSQLRQSEILTQNKLKDLGDRKERALTNLDKVNQQLMDQGIVASQWGKVQDPTDASKEIIGKLGEDAQRNFEFAQQEYNTVEEGIIAGETELSQITEQLRQSEAVMGGIMYGNQKAMDIRDFNTDDKLNALDVLNYFEVKNAGEKSLEEANQMLAGLGQDVTGMTELQQHGFNLGFKTAQETFYKPLDAQATIDLKKSNIEKAKLKAQHNVKINPFKNLTIRDRDYAKRYTNTGLNPKFKELWETFPLTKMKSDAGAQEAIAKDPTLLFNKTIDFSDHMYKALDYLENETYSITDWDMTSTDNNIEKYLESYKDAKLPSEKKDIMMNMATYLIGADGKKGFDNFKELISGDERDKVEIWKLMEHFQDIYKEELMYNKPISDPEFDLEADPGNLLAP